MGVGHYHNGRVQHFVLKVSDYIDINAIPRVKEMYYSILDCIIVDMQLWNIMYIHVSFVYKHPRC
jgi:hypothetical protein